MAVQARSLVASRTNLTESLKEGGLRSTATGHRLRLRRLLVVVEVALAVVIGLAAPVRAQETWVGGSALQGRVVVGADGETWVGVGWGEEFERRERRRKGGGGDPGIAEWIMQNKEIPIKDYEKLPAFFNPQKFDAAAWVQMAREAGMKYITITSKHHDGFAIYDSALVSLNEIQTTNIIKVYPNPFNEVVNIAIENNDYKTISVEILDITGKTMYNKTVNNNSVLQVSANYPAGIYFIKVIGDTTLLKTEKLVKF